MDDPNEVTVALREYSPMRYPVLNLVFIVGLAGLFSMAPTTVFADDADLVRQVEILAQEGGEFYGQGEYEKAIERFEAAYELHPEPTLLFNIGHCYQELEDWEQAEHYYDQFVSSPDVEDEARRMATERIDTVREHLEAEREEQRRKEEELAAKEAEEEARRREELEEPNPLYAYATLGAGVGLLAGGATLGLMARSNADTMSDTTVAHTERLDAQSSARTQGIVADVFFLSGLAATAVGAYLYLSIRDDASAAEFADAPRLVPYAGGDATGIGFHLDF